MFHRAAILLSIVVIIVISNTTDATFHPEDNHPDRFCVRNFGCDTEFQDMALGVSFDPS